MYKLLLTFRYLRRKLIPLFALLAVTLCVAMLIIVLSIMGGFHDLLLNAGTKLMGDVRISYGAEGFAHYDPLIEELEALPEVKAATPIIETFGLLKSPGGSTHVVEVLGIRPDSYDRATRYRETIYWTGDKLREHYFAERYGEPDPLGAGVALSNPWPDDTPRGRALPANLGIEVNPYNTRTDRGTYEFPNAWLGRRLSLTLVPLSRQGGLLEPSVDQFVVVNEFHSGLFEVDSKRVFVRFDDAQRMLLMDEAPRVDPNDPSRVIGTVPARCSAIIVRAHDGVSPEQLLPVVRSEYDRFQRAHTGMPQRPFMMIYTWRQLMRSLLDTVQNEKNLMAFLFGIVSFVAVIMVLVIFYMIVLEKTRDIGILRALGAGRLGVASIFLVYAAVIGTIGSALGTLVAWLTVKYINELHAWLGEAFGIVIWDRRVYFFDEIPNRVNWVEIAIIVAAAIIASVFGAIVPAIRAARVDPVESLRYE